jgi:hypothetical protein
MTKSKKTTPAKGAASKKGVQSNPKSEEENISPKKSYNDDDDEDDDDMDLEMDDMDVDYGKDVAFDDDDDDDDF